MEYVRSEYSSLLDIGVDYITATTQGGHDSKRLALMAEGYMEGERRAGNYIQGWGMEGYKGFKCGAAQGGVRGQEVLLRLSSHLAKRHWREVYLVADNVSRLDIQTTFRIPSAGSHYEYKLYKRAIRQKEKLRGNWDVGINEHHMKGAMVNVGSRVSDTYMRVYDKFYETGLDEYRDAHRFEIEFKRRLAKMKVRQLASEEDEAPLIVGLMSSAIHDRLKAAAPVLGCITGIKALARGSTSSHPSDSFRALAWLTKSVKPTVERLITMGYSDEVLSALGLSEIAQVKTVSSKSAETTREKG